MTCGVRALVLLNTLNALFCLPQAHTSAELLSHLTQRRGCQLNENIIII